MCLAIVLRETLQQREIISVKDAVEEIITKLKKNVSNVIKDNNHIDTFFKTISGNELLLLQTVMAMAINIITNDDTYLSYGLDMLASLKPGLVVPESLVRRYLMNPFFEISPFGKLGNHCNNSKNHIEEQTDKSEAKTVWTSKTMTKYFKQLQDYLGTFVTTVKAIYDLLYRELPQLPEKDDDLGIFHSCELLLNGTLEPGGNLFVLIFRCRFFMVKITKS